MSMDARNTPARTLDEAISCVSDYDPKALPVSSANAIIGRLLSPVRETELLPVREALGRVLEQTPELAERISAVLSRRQAGLTQTGDMQRLARTTQDVSGALLAKIRAWDFETCIRRPRLGAAQKLGLVARAWWRARRARA